MTSSTSSDFLLQGLWPPPVYTCLHLRLHYKRETSRSPWRVAKRGAETSAWRSRHAGTPRDRGRKIPCAGSSGCQRQARGSSKHPSPLRGRHNMLTIPLRRQLAQREQSPTIGKNIEQVRLEPRSPFRPSKTGVGCRTRLHLERAPHRHLHRLGLCRRSGYAEKARGSPARPARDRRDYRTAWLPWREPSVIAVGEGLVKRGLAESMQSSTGAHLQVFQSVSHTP